RQRPGGWKGPSQATGGAGNPSASAPPDSRRGPTFGLLGDAQDLAQGLGLARLGRAEAEVVEEAADGEGVGDEGDDAHALAAAGDEGAACQAAPSRYDDLAEIRRGRTDRGSSPCPTRPRS